MGEAQRIGELTGRSRKANRRTGKMEKAGGDGDEGGVVFGLVPRVIAAMYDAWVAQLYKHAAIRMIIITTMPVTVASGATRRPG